MKTYWPKSLLMVAFGAAIGYLAALSPLERASNAAPSEVSQEQTEGRVTNAPQPEASCSDGLARADQVALANHNQLVAASLAQTGKKPNILII